jgi:hypothetical protein
MLVPNTNTRARCTGDDEAPLRPGTRPVLLTLLWAGGLVEFLSPSRADPKILDHEPRFLDDLAVLTDDFYPLTEEALSLVYHEGGLYAAPA